MIAKFQWIVKQMITRNDLPRKARVVNPIAQKSRQTRSILVNYGLGNTLVMEVS